jgi:c(7)-type cytochrome triheme protein
MSARPRARWTWTAALAVACLSPVVLAAAFPAVLRIPRQSPGASAVPPRALFSHRTHGDFGCYACHPSVFPQAPVGFTHAQMRDARFCGRCHDGTTSFAIEGAPCGRCHVDAR